MEVVVVGGSHRWCVEVVGARWCVDVIGGVWKCVEVVGGVWKSWVVCGSRRCQVVCGS